MFYEKENSMKIVKLFLLLSLLVWADFKLDIPQNIDVSELENIVKNGWNEDNKTLNDLIVSNTERVMPEILEKIKTPFKKEISTKENRFPIPTIHLRREDFWFILAYTKYLEYHNNIDKSLKLNMEILKGLKTIEDTSMLSVIYSLVVEGIVRDSISQLLVKNRNFTKQEVVELKSLSNLLTLNTSAFFTAMKGERDTLLNIDLYRETKEKYLAQEVGKNYKFLMEDVQQYLEVFQDSFYQKMFYAMSKETPEAIDIYEEEITKMRKSYTSNINRIHFIASSLWIKIKSLLGMEIKDFGYVSQYLAHNLVYVAMPKVAQTYKDYLNHIKENQSFLEKLKTL